MPLVISEHARERFSERVWPTMFPRQSISNPTSIDRHLTTIYANSRTIGQPYPPDLHQWLRLVKLGDGKYVRIDDSTRTILVCKKDNGNDVVLTCLSATLPGMTAAQTKAALDRRLFMKSLDAVVDVCPAMSGEQQVAIAARLAEALEEK